MAVRRAGRVIRQTVSRRPALQGGSPEHEAGRGAGEAGRGFAVVAEEVRRLAASTSQATLKITRVVEENTTLIENMTQQLEEIKRFLTAENDKISNLSRSFQEINRGVNEFVTVIHRLNV